MEQRTIAGRYELIEPLGSGWRARDTELEREVVVRLGADAEVGATALAHPSIERVFDQGEADGERYAVLEYLPGGTLAERGAQTEDDASHLAAALAYAHAQGVVHGSIGPESVLFDSEGRAKLAGFGDGGEPEDDVRALGALIASYVQAAPPAPEPTTLIQPRPPRPARRRPWALVALIAAALLAAGVGAAFFATSDDSNAEPPTLSVPIPTGSAESTSDETEAPQPTTAETTTEQTTTATTEPEPEPAPATTAPPRGTIAPPPTTEPPLPTTEPPPPATIEPPPPPATEPPPATTAPA